MTVQLSWADWSWEPSVIGGVIAAALSYWMALRSGVLDAPDVLPWLPGSRWRPWLFGAGLATVYVALQSPIDRGGDQFLLSLHMVQHLLLMMVAPPLLLLGVCGARAPARPRARGWRTLWRVITRPVPALITFNAVLLVWHLPVLYNTTLTVAPLHVFEHVTFVAAGVVFWWSVVDPVRDSSTRPITPMEKIAALVISGIPPTALGLVLSLARQPFYDFYAQAPRLWGMSALGDQQVAGVIMFGAGNIIYFAAVSVIFLRLFVDPAEDEARSFGGPPGRASA